MSSDIVISAENLGKKYIIGHQSADRSNTFREVITQNVKNFVRGAREMAQGKAIIAGDELEEFWALKDMSFEIKRGDVVGIIGRNGAGKSTLLKVLSRITEPTQGRVEIKGRVASLLEVGTGFHAELSGRENIYLNGAILGMSRSEIKRKFEEIVEFSGVEKFLDTPVKRYSSGMYVRLAFAVAAHLEPEILIVDEVLAVGDAEFQKKCLGKMQDVAGQGRTVLFVSHNMGAVQSLCNTGMYLSGGQLVNTGTTAKVIESYHSNDDAKLATVVGELTLDQFQTGYDPEKKEIRVSMDIWANQQTNLRDFSILFYSQDGVRLGICDLRSELRLPCTLEIGKHSVSMTIGPIGLVEGIYNIGLYLSTDKVSSEMLDHCALQVPPGNSDVSPYAAAHRGYISFAIQRAQFA